MLRGRRRGGRVFERRRLEAKDAAVTRRRRTEVGAAGRASGRCPRERIPKVHTAAGTRADGHGVPVQSGRVGRVLTVGKLSSLPPRRGSARVQVALVARRESDRVIRSCKLLVADVVVCARPARGRHRLVRRLLMQRRQRRREPSRRGRACAQARARARPTKRGRTVCPQPSRAALYRRGVRVRVRRQAGRVITKLHLGRLSLASWWRARLLQLIGAASRFRSEVSYRSGPRRRSVVRWN